MSERGAAIVEVLIVLLTAGVIWAAALASVRDLPAQVARWEEAAASRQRIRVIEWRAGRVIAGAAHIDADIEGVRVRVPSIWPRRLGLIRAGPPGEVSNTSATALTRVDAHRSLVLTSALSSAGSSVAAVPQQGCGTAPMCGLRNGDLALVVARTGACGLFRVESIGERLGLSAVMAGAPMFDPGSVLIPVRVDVIAFDGDESAIRRYDGYRSDNIVADGIRGARIEYASNDPIVLGDGPFVGTGAMAFDIDQLAITGIALRLSLEDAASAVSARGALLEWRVRGWP